MTERARASARDILPRKVISEFCGLHEPYEMALSSIVEYGDMSCCRAVMYTKGLKAEPGWRTAMVARLKLSWPRPPTIARMWPFLGSMETRAPCGWVKPFSSL